MWDFRTQYRVPMGKNGSLLVHNQSKNHRPWVTPLPPRCLEGDEAIQKEPSRFCPSHFSCTEVTTSPESCRQGSMDKRLALKI